MLGQSIHGNRRVDFCVYRDKETGEHWGHAVSAVCAFKYGDKPFPVQFCLNGDPYWAWCEK